MRKTAIFAFANGFEALPRCIRQPAQCELLYPIGKTRFEVLSVETWRLTFKELKPLVPQLIHIFKFERQDLFKVLSLHECASQTCGSLMSLLPVLQVSEVRSDRKNCPVAQAKNLRENAILRGRVPVSGSLIPVSQPGSEFQEKVGSS